MRRQAQLLLRRLLATAVGVLAVPEAHPAVVAVLVVGADGQRFAAAFVAIMAIFALLRIATGLCAAWWATGMHGRLRRQWVGEQRRHGARHVDMNICGYIYKERDGQR